MTRPQLRVRSRAHRLGSETGAVAITFAAALFLFGAFGVVAVDIASWYGDRREAQTDADHIALAGAIELPDFEDDAQAVQDAEDAALDWAAKNNVAPEDVEIEVVNDCYSNSDELHTGVRATVQRPGKTFFLSFLPDAIQPTISTTAVACSGMPYEMIGMMPFALQMNSDCFTDEADPAQRRPRFGERCDILIANNGSDVGQLAFSTDPTDACYDASNSANEYEANIINGSMVRCAVGGDVTGNNGVNVGKTRTGLRTRLQSDGLCSSSGTRVFSDVQDDTDNFNLYLTPLEDPATGIDDFFEIWRPGLNYDETRPAENLETVDCDPTQPGVQSSVRNVTVIVIHDVDVHDGNDCNNAHCYRIRGFARMYLEGCSIGGSNFRADCSQGGGGNQFTLHARFVESVGITSGALGLSRYGDTQTFLKE